MDASQQDLTYEVVNGSGTGALTGISGTLSLTIAEGGEHHYELSYQLP